MTSAASSRGLTFLTEDLDRLAAAGLLRSPREHGDGVGFATNDYFGLGRSGATTATAAPWGATGSRLISGDHFETRTLESELARWLQVPKALVFTSGYAANVGALSALLGPEDLVLSDALNHASLIDGIRLSRAAVKVFPHNDLEALDSLLSDPSGHRRRWVVTESYFSMDADGPDLPALRALCDRTGALLYLDEAHALGVAGPSGRGFAAAAGIEPDVLSATLGKSLGAQGAFIAGPAPLYDYLWNRARSFVFSTGLSPAVAAQAARNLRTVEGADEQRTALLRRAARFRNRLSQGGKKPLGHGAIVPLVLGSEHAALGASEAMRLRGFHVQPIRPPTVAAGTSRLRITLTTRETDAEVEACAAALLEVLADGCES